MAARAHSASPGRNELHCGDRLEQRFREVPALTQIQVGDLGSVPSGLMGSTVDLRITSRLRAAGPPPGPRPRNAPPSAIVRSCSLVWLLEVDSSCRRQSCQARGHRSALSRRPAARPLPDPPRDVPKDLDGRSPSRPSASPASSPRRSAGCAYRRHAPRVWSSELLQPETRRFPMGLEQNALDDRCRADRQTIVGFLRYGRNDGAADPINHRRYSASLQDLLCIGHASGTPTSPSRRSIVPSRLKWHLVASAELRSFQVRPDKIEVSCPDLSGTFGDGLGCRCST